MDPFLDLIGLLRPSATLWIRVDVSGRWAVSFPALNDLLFTSITAGGCLLLRSGHPPLPLQTGDFLVIRTTEPFLLASDPETPPEDSNVVLAPSLHRAARLGSGTENPGIIHGGRFVFESANENLLTSLMPPLVHVPATGPTAQRLRPLLEANARESLSPLPGSNFVITRLMELIFVELLRADPPSLAERTPGLLTGLADPVAAPALQAIHTHVSQAWTVASLARLSNTSRSAFSARFQQTVGLAPIEYLNQWRMAVAKDQLQRGGKTVAEIAFSIGFQSASAFSTAFSKRVGMSPKSFALAGKGR